MTVLPTRGWESYERTLKLIGEHRPVDNAEDLSFLSQLGFARANGDLTNEGKTYFHQRFIRGNMAACDAGIHQAMIRCPPAAAICQLLEGVPGVRRDVVETLLRRQGFT